jgi:hypothetical protein
VTKSNLSLVDFVKENPQLIEDFKTEYDWYKDNPEYTQENLLKSAKQNNMVFTPGSTEAVFGDEDGTLIGNVFDYILREGGKSKSFLWHQNGSLR